ncbi:AraC family transcriptional regulator [Erythrobacter alti]|uniref:helix-turn-helix domain-containing protein n=1 Tax=Erythrobacter alti TaxID=1896145 RepID=UPI0030F4A66D
MGSQQAVMSLGVDAPVIGSRFFAPPPEFKGCFTTFYRLTLDLPDGDMISDYMQPEWASLRFFSGARPMATIGQDELSGARFAATGVSSMPARFTIGSTKMWGIGILPLGWARLFDADARQLANRLVDGEQHPLFSRLAPLADILGDETISDDKQYCAIVEAMRSTMRLHRDEARIIRVHEALLEADLKTVSDMAECAGLTVRSLERRCHRHFGFAPKILMRRQRFVRSLTTFILDSDGKWSEAMDVHYHDQSQFSREFTRFMGMRPSKFATLDHPFMKAFVAARTELLGSAAQTLDAPDR